MKYSRGGAPGGKPDVFTAVRRDTGIAGGKGTFSLKSRWNMAGIDVLPGLPAIPGAKDLKLAVHRVTDYHRMALIRKHHAVQKALRLLIGELEYPRFPHP